MPGRWPPDGHTDRAVPQSPPQGNGVRPITIAVDAMGGDHGPAEIVAGAVAAAHEHGIQVILVGRPHELGPLLSGQIGAGQVGAGQVGQVGAGQIGSGQIGSGRTPVGTGAADGRAGRIRIAVAEDAVGMDEGALASWRRPRSSIAVACQWVRRGQADAVVSAGSTAGIVATARLRLRSLPGLMRPGLAVVLPTRPTPTFLVDAGAIADPKPEMLVQFAQLGVAYAQVAYGIESPRVGLLTIGAEPGKGNKLARRAHELFTSPPPHGSLPIRFLGNIEGGDLLTGKVDVIVTDGFTGNVALKSIEGAVSYATGQVRGALQGSTAARFGTLFQRRALREAGGRMDAETYGGAALLGLEGTVVIAHGASTAKGVAAACALAADLARGQITDRIRERLGPGRAGHFLRRT